MSNDWKDRLGVVYSTNNDYEYEKENEEELETLTPKGYSPIFMNSIQPITNLTDSTAVNLFIESTETYIDKVKIKLSIIDSNGIYYSNAAEKVNRKIWCLIEETADGKTYEINDYIISEATVKNADPVAIALVMDHSGSMGEERARKMQQAVVSLIKSLRLGDAMCLIKYDNKVITEVPLTTDKTTLLNGFGTNGLEGYGYTTAVANGVMEAVGQLKNNSLFKEKYIIVFTDGKDNSSTVEPINAIMEANKNNIKVMRLILEPIPNLNICSLLLIPLGVRLIIFMLLMSFNFFLMIFIIV